MISFQIFYALEKGFKEYSHLLKLKPIKIMVFVSIDNFIIFSRDSKSLEGGQHIRLWTLVLGRITLECNTSCSQIIKCEKCCIWIWEWIKIRLSNKVKFFAKIFPLFYEDLRSNENIMMLTKHRRNQNESRGEKFSPKAISSPFPSNLFRKS